VPADGQAGITLVGDVTDGGPELTGRAFVTATQARHPLAQTPSPRLPRRRPQSPRDLLPDSTRLLTAKDGTPMTSNQRPEVSELTLSGKD
jgi:hypothetical protein